MTVPRRHVLAGLGAITASTLAGCGTQIPARTSIAMFVTNESGVERRVTLRLYRLPEPHTRNARDGTPATGDLEQVFVHRAVLNPDEDVAVSGEDLPAGDVRVRVVTADGPAGTHDWDRLDGRSTLDVRIRAGAIRFTEVD